MKPVESLVPHGLQVAANYRPTGMKPVVAKHRKKCFTALPYGSYKALKFQQGCSRCGRLPMIDLQAKLAILADAAKRNYVEGLFLSSGIIQNSDYTMEQLTLVAKKLRTEHHFGGYIHLKTIPNAAQALID